MTFDKILTELQNGKLVRRECWRDGLIIFMQIPANISAENTWNMKSLPGDMKIFLKQNNLPIYYHDQFIVYDSEDQEATYCIFDGEDITAADWEVIDPFTYSYE